MVRCTHASLCFFALTSSLLVQSSDAARPSQGEMQRQPPAPAASPAGSSPTAELAVDPESIAAGAARDVEAAATTATAAAAVGDRGGYGGPRPPTSVAQVLRYSARRLLLGEDAATDGAAGASCHSNNVHITCSPPSPH